MHMCVAARGVHRIVKRLVISIDIREEPVQICSISLPFMKTSVMFCQICVSDDVLRPFSE